MPLSQSVLMDTYPPERQGTAMSSLGMAIMIGPIIGPVLGGWLTENYKLAVRLFTSNVPIGHFWRLSECGLFLAETKK